MLVEQVLGVASGRVTFRPRGSGYDADTLLVSRQLRDGSTISGNVAEDAARSASDRLR